MEIVELETVTSTNDELKKLAERGAKPFTVVTAKTQTKGRGRYDRKWESSEGNLFLSILVNFSDKFPAISLITGLAVYHTIQKFTKAETKIKWPNDVLVNGKKICGILLEKVEDKIVIGIGLNIINSPEYATDLKKLGVETSTKEVQKALLYEVQKYLEELEKKGFLKLKQEWLNHAAFLNEEIKVKSVNNEISGKFEGITDEGLLMLYGNTIINAGEIFG